MSKLNRRVGFKCSDHEIEILNKKIANTNLTKSEFLRQSIFYNQIKTVDKSFQKRQLFLIHNIANNCNQLAKHCNTYKRIDRQVLLKLSEILEYAKKISSKQSEDKECTLK